MRIELTAHNDYNEDYNNFIRDNEIGAVIGFSGSANSKLHGVNDSELEEQYSKFKNSFVEKLITGILKPLRGYKIAILTGGTKGGVPELATEIAKDYRFKTIGVFPRKGDKYKLDYLDVEICVEPTLGESFWGAEGPVWTSLIDGMVVIGGGAGTLTECAHIQKINEWLVPRRSEGREPKYIVPIQGTGGVAEQLHHLWTNPEIRIASMPDKHIYNGCDVAMFLIEKLNLEEHHFFCTQE